VLADGVQFALGSRGVACQQLDISSGGACMGGVESRLLRQCSCLRREVARGLEVALHRDEVRTCDQESHLEPPVDRGA
jgi:hypothetical protein